MLASRVHAPAMATRCASTAGRRGLASVAAEASALSGFRGLELTTPGSRVWVGGWMLTNATIVFGMVILGGVTRLTHSGLSMTEWRPQGHSPPSTLEEWEAEFDKYKQSPEFKELRPDMTLEGFKPIFWFEYLHRMLGRSLGVTFGLPAIAFAASGAIKRPLLLPLGLLFTAGGCQGLIGWWMVRSGLQDVPKDGGYGDLGIPRVSPYRLATHLTSAFCIYSGIVWTALSVLSPEPRLQAATVAEVQGAMKIKRFVLPFAVLVGVTAVSGAFVAGMQAGMHFNTFPLMDGRVVPEDYGEGMVPWWRNYFEHIPTVQFDHRLLAVTTFWSGWALFALSRRQPHLPAYTRNCITGVALAASAQATLGVVTLVNAVPVSLGAAHQGGALTLFTIVIALVHSLRTGRGMATFVRHCASQVKKTRTVPATLSPLPATA